MSTGRNQLDPRWDGSQYEEQFQTDPYAQLQDGMGVNGDEFNEQRPEIPYLQKPLCISMDEMTTVAFDFSVFTTILLAMFVPFPFLFRIWQIFQGNGGTVFELAHLAIIAYPLVLYNLWLWIKQEDIIHIRWQSEVLLPIVSYVLVAFGLAVYHSFRNITQIGAEEKKQSNPVITDEQWNALYKAGEFLEHHGIFDIEKSVTEQESENFKMDIVFKMIVYSRFLGLIHPAISPLYYYITYNGALLFTSAETQMVICAVIANFFIISQAILTCIKAIFLFQYRLHTVEKFSHVSNISLEENPFQLQAPEGLQFWMDARFIVIRHDLKRIIGLETLVNGMSLIILFGSSLQIIQLLSVSTNSASDPSNIFGWGERVRFFVDFTIFGLFAFAISALQAKINDSQKSHAGVISMKRYELSLFEPTGADISVNKNVVLFNQVVEHIENFDMRPTFWGQQINMSVVYFVGGMAFLGALVAIDCFRYTTLTQ